LTQHSDAALERLLAPGAESLGFELVAVELAPQGRDTILRVYIDSPEGITLDDCEAVSRQLSAILDVEDPIHGHYTLEVSSPGLDRPLTKQEHFERFVGHTVKVRMHAARDGRRKYTGVLQGVRDGRILIETDGEVHELPLNDVEMARLVPQW
jgi:ribosome maturation factor RimP